MILAVRLFDGYRMGDRAHVLQKLTPAGGQDSVKLAAALSANLSGFPTGCGLIQLTFHVDS